MKLRKYEHACFTVEQDGQILVVDPGNWSTDFVTPENVVGVIITHEHADHFDQEHIAQIVDKNPHVLIISHQNITNLIKITQTKSVLAGETLAVGPFTLEFFGGQHATIYPDLPSIPNLGVMINNRIYYPGDSFAQPTKPVDTLALPVSAPWLKMSEALDFFNAIHPRFAFPTHDNILSDFGKATVDAHVASAAEKIGATYQRLNREAIEL